MSKSYNKARVSQLKTWISLELKKLKKKLVNFKKNR